VLSIVKLRVGQEAYQLSGVAQSLDDYYTGAGEASGVWAGIGAERLGLSGVVTADDLRAVLAGIAPGTGGLTPDGGTVRPHVRRVPGFDLTFKAPKSVSVLYGVSDDPRVQHAIVDAGEVAARAALGWLEREAIHVRRGSGNAALLNDLAARDPEAAEAARLRVVPASGVVAAMFRHRTSRAGDPLLHWHTLVANMAEGPDGRWTALHGADLYRAVRAAGEVFQSVLRDELGERLGVEWRPGRHVPEIAGIPQGLLDQFSKRSKEIEDWLANTGTPADAAGRQAAVLATRRNKPEVEHERFDAAWKAEAETFGWGPAEAEALLLSHTPRTVSQVDDAWVAALARDLTEHDSTFTRNDIVQAVSARLDSGASIGHVERTVAAVLASTHVVPVGDNEGRWTSRALLDVERRLLNTATGSVGSRPPTDPAIVAATLARFPTIGDDQHAAVVRLTKSSDAVSVLVGPAGTGKTFTLDAIRVVYETAGYRVIGAAPSARAAHELEAGAQIPSATIHRLLNSWSRGFDLPDRTTVLVIDESAMAGTRDLEAIVTATVRAGGRVLLVGDHHQLPEVTAGGGFAALATGRVVTVAELTVNRRQHHEWERAALGELRDGHVAKAVAAYRDHGRVDIAADRTTMLDTAVSRWIAATQTGLNPVLLAGTNATVDALNQNVRRHLQADGNLSESVGTWAGREFAVGERVVLRMNDYRATAIDGQAMPLLNGHTATILCGTGGGVIARLDHTDTNVALSTEYLAAGAVDYAYALTSHRAQGGTWDLAIAVGADGLYREAGYLVLSRGRTENWLVLTQAEIDGLGDDLVRHDSVLALPGEEPEDPDTELERRLNTSRAKTLALTVDPHADLIAGLAQHTDLPTLEILAAHARRSEQTAESIIGTTATSLRSAIDRAVHTAEHIAVGQSVKPNDRNNVGTVAALNDLAGTVAVRFVSADGRSAERTFRWDQVGILEPRHPQPRQMAPDAITSMNTIVTEHQQQVIRWDAVLAGNNVAPDDARIYGSAARLHLDRCAAHLAADQPDWLTRTVGTRPTAPAAAQVWDDAVRDIAAFRARDHVTDRSTPLGLLPADPSAAVAWETASISVAEARIWLDTYSPAPTAPLRARTLTELAERRSDLDVILATAPADQRHIVQALTSGQLAIGDTAEILRDALNQQGDRRRWILEHWPHIVESAEVDTGLSVVAAISRPEFDQSEIGQRFNEPETFVLDLD
jgi:conjugative relaxase-like TrwC/TraI family protein